MNELFEKSMRERQQEIDKILRDGFEKDKAHSKELKEKEQEFERKLVIEQVKFEEVKKEMMEKKEQQDLLFEEKFKFEGILCGKDMRTRHLELEILRATEEISCRKIVIEQMTTNLLSHERESEELASKLSLMKTQIIENETGYGMEKKFGCVKINSIRKNEVCTVSRFLFNFSD